MADPVVSQLAAGSSATATTTVNFTAQAAGTLLVLTVSADDYKTGDPSGWTLSTGMSQQGYQGHYLWWRKATGSETSVAYTIGSASGSAYALIALTNIAGTSQLDVSNGSYVNGSLAGYTTPSVTTTSGRRVAVASIGISDAGRDSTGVGSWTNSFTERADARNTPASGIQNGVGVATLVFDGGGAVSTGATVEGGDGLITAGSGLIAVFKVASSSDGAVPGVAAAVTATAVAPAVAAQGVVQATAPGTVSVTGKAPAVVGTSGSASVTAVAATISVATGTPGVTGTRPDPTATLIASGTSTTATTTPTFTAQASGVVLFLAVAADAYRSGTPSGWTLVTGGAQEVYLGHYLFYKVSNGTETSVSYTLSGVYHSAYAVLAVANVNTSSLFDASGGQSAIGFATAYSTPTVTTTSGRRISIATIGASNGPRSMTGVGSWTNGYTELADVRTSPPLGTTQDELGIATLVFDGGSTTSTQATFETDNADSASGIIAVLRAADGNYSVSAVAATASVTALAPTVTTGTVANVSAVAATVSVAAGTPAVGAISSANVAAVKATAATAAEAPAVTGEMVLSGGGAAGVTVAANAPTVSVTGGVSATVLAIKATVNVAAGTPSTFGGTGATVSAVVATATATAVAPAVTVGTAGTVNAVVAGTVSVAGRAPTISLIGIVNPPAATATAAAPAPEVVGNLGISLTPPAATVNADAIAPSASGTAYITVPVVDTAVATGTPEVTGGGTVQATAASVVIGAIWPLVNTNGNVTIPHIKTTLTVGAGTPVVSTVDPGARDLTYHLNRLAGTLVNDMPTLAAQGAANVWAGTTGLALVGALNTKLGITSPKDWRDLRGICNMLGGTDNLDPADALSQASA